MTADQLEFARTHGITRCPPSPKFRMPWHSQGDERQSEEEMLGRLAGIEFDARWCPRYVFIKGVAGRGRKRMVLQYQKAPKQGVQETVDC